MPKGIPIVFHNGSNYDYFSIINVLAEEPEGQFTCLEENTKKCITFLVPIEKEVKGIDKKGKEITKKCITFLVPIEKEVKGIDKKGKEITKIYPAEYNLLISQDLWQAHYQILLIISLNKFIKLNLNTDIITKNVKRAGSSTKIATVEYTSVIDDLIEYKYYMLQ